LTGQSGKPGFAWSELWPMMNARAAVVVMFSVFLVTYLSADWLHVVALTGFGFAAGSAAAVGRTRRKHLLLVTTTPPALFLAAVITAELLTLHLDHVAATPGLVLANVFLTLSAAAPWLFGGVAGTLVIAMARGLPRCVRDLRAQLRASVMGDELPVRRGGS
jgi:hypothetical protein